MYVPHPSQCVKFIVLIDKCTGKRPIHERGNQNKPLWAALRYSNAVSAEGSVLEGSEWLGELTWKTPVSE